MRERMLFIFFSITIALVMIVFAVLIFLRFSSQNLPGTAPTPTPVPLIPTPTPIVIPFEKPTGETFVVKGIPVKNFYNSGTVIDTNGDVSIKKTPLYNLVYLAPFREFIIDIQTSPFESARKSAEQAFLTELGLTEEQACKTTVSVGTSAEINPNEAGQRYPLSFCGN